MYLSNDTRNVMQVCRDLYAIDAEKPDLNLTFHKKCRSIPVLCINVLGIARLSFTRRRNS